MNDEGKVIKNGVEVDLERVKHIINRALLYERQNNRTNRYSDSAVVDKLVKMVEEEVNAFKKN